MDCIFQVSQVPEANPDRCVAPGSLDRGGEVAFLQCFLQFVEIQSSAPAAFPNQVLGRHPCASLLVLVNAQH